mgnify:CR=1 FL=1
MSSPKKINLQGFEDALREKISASFKFSGIFLETLTLVSGRHLFVNDVPDDDELKQQYPDFDGDKEPIVGIYTTPTEGIRASTGSGSKHDWTLRLDLRLGAVAEVAKEKLEELFEWLLVEVPGVRMGSFIVRGVLSSTRPISFRREGDDGRHASATVRFLGVSLD